MITRHPSGKAQEVKRYSTWEHLASLWLGGATGLVLAFTTTAAVLLVIAAAVVTTAYSYLVIWLEG